MHNHSVLRLGTDIVGSPLLFTVTNNDSVCLFGKARHDQIFNSYLAPFAFGPQKYKFGLLSFRLAQPSQPDWPELCHPARGQSSKNKKYKQIRQLISKVSTTTSTESVRTPLRVYVQNSDLQGAVMRCQQRRCHEETGSRTQQTRVSIDPTFSFASSYSCVTDP